MSELLKNLKKYLTPRNIIAAVSVLLIVSITVAACIIVGGKSEPQPNEPTVSDAPVTEPEPEPEPIPEPEPEPEIELIISSPADDDVTTTEPTFVFSGSSDPEEKLLLNGEEVERNTDGSFTFTAELKIGANTFKFEHKDKVITKTVRYRYVVIESYEPAGSKTYSSGSVLTVSVMARDGSTVTATLNGQTVTCQKTSLKNDGDAGIAESGAFTNYTGTFRLPSGNVSDINIGKITFKATYNGITETMQSGAVTVKKSSIIKDSDPSVTPSGGKYIDVGSGLIATIVTRSAETFEGDTTDDDSRPYNNYLPEGTQDYCAEGIVTNGSKEYYTLRCGRRIYNVSYPTESYSQTVATTSVGILPDHNELSIKGFETDGRYTTLTLESDWKAPFYFEALNQSYRKTRLGYTMDAVTFSYIDITFCYATVFEGEIALPENHPIFKSAEIIKNESDYTLRLTLNKTGGFYGWDCYYDENNNLVFKFLNPAKMESEDSLNGITVYIDVGHGGKDGGAWIGNNNEAQFNLTLANKVRERLEATGATVLMNRVSSDTYISPPDRMNLLRDANADLCVAIHHDSSTSTSPTGFLSAYFTPYSRTAAEFILQRTENAEVYQKIWEVESHYYYVSRVTACPVVLTENGFISNKFDYNNIVNSATTDKKADAIVAGIVDYFRSIQ